MWAQLSEAVDRRLRHGFVVPHLNVSEEDCDKFHSCVGLFQDLPSTLGGSWCAQLEKLDVCPAYAGYGWQHEEDVWMEFLRVASEGRFPALQSWPLRSCDTWWSGLKEPQRRERAARFLRQVASALTRTPMVALLPNSWPRFAPFRGDESTAEAWVALARAVAQHPSMNSLCGLFETPVGTSADSNMSGAVGIDRFFDALLTPQCRLTVVQVPGAWLVTPAAREVVLAKLEHTRIEMFWAPGADELVKKQKQKQKQPTTAKAELAKLLDEIGELNHRKKVVAGARATAAAHAVLIIANRPRSLLNRLPGWWVQQLARYVHASTFDLVCAMSSRQVVAEARAAAAKPGKKRGGRKQ